MILQYPRNVPDIFFWGGNMYYYRSRGYVVFGHPDTLFPDPELEISWPDGSWRLSDPERIGILMSQLVAGSKKESAVLNELVLLHEGRGDHPAAVPFYQRLMRINPGPQSQFFLSAGLGNELVNGPREKHIAAAVGYFRAALDVVRPADQDTVCVSASFAECCNRLGKYEEAEACCRRALKVVGDGGGSPRTIRPRPRRPATLAGGGLGLCRCGKIWRFCRIAGRLAKVFRLAQACAGIGIGIW